MATEIDHDEPPPIGKSWQRLYALVLISLAVEIALLWALGRV